MRTPRKGLMGVLLILAIGGCGSAAPHPSRSSAAGPARTTSPTSSGQVAGARILTEAVRAGPAWRPVVTIGGQPAVWLAMRTGVTLMRLDQRLVHLALHAGYEEPSGPGWEYGSSIGASEVHRVVASFNGGFRLGYGSVGFMSNGRVGAALAAGRGSIVTYRDGFTEIGTWHAGVPQSGRTLASVLQNLAPMVDHSQPAASVERCPLPCWGSTLGGGVEVARSALGIRGDGELVWAGGASLSPGAIARGLVGAGVQRAVELDINPEWVAGYLYVHHGGEPTAAPVVPGQVGIPGHLLRPYARDFFTVLAN